MRHIIVCDNDRDLLGFLSAMLCSVGHIVKAVADGTDAIALLSDGHPCDVVVTDGTMTTMHGWDVLEYTRKNHPHIPVILVSGKASDPDHRARLDQMGFAAILTKPLSAKHLIETIKIVSEPPGI